MACLKANDVCAGASCLDALYERKSTFSIYEGEEIRLTAFLRCSQCQVFPEDDPGMTEKLNRIVSSGTETVHIGICSVNGETGELCPYMECAARWLREQGMKIVWGTHGTIRPKKVCSKW